MNEQQTNYLNDRVPTCLENQEKSGNLRVWKSYGIPESVRKFHINSLTAAIRGPG